MESNALPPGNRRHAGAVPSLHTFAFRNLPAKSPAIQSPCSSAIDQAGYKLPIDERILADTDTLMVFGLDHLVSEQEAAPEEIAAIREWLKREGTCLIDRTASRCGFYQRHEAAPDGIRAPWRRPCPAPAALRTVHPFVDEGARSPGDESIRAPSGGRQRHSKSRHSRSTRTWTSSACSTTSRPSTFIPTCRTTR